MQHSETLYCLTGNTGKFKEFKERIPGIKQLNVDLPEIQELDARKIIQKKLQSASESYAGRFIVEDTSLYLNALNGLPGPLIKWFLESIGNSGLYGIADKLENTICEARTIIGYTDGNETFKYFEGSVEGKVVSPKGREGFGWDPIFKPKGSARTYAEIDAADKSQISPRGFAIQKLMQYLDSI